MQQQMQEDMQECIDNCFACSKECETALFTYCLEQGGQHTAPAHVKLMADCIDICLTAGRAMLRGSALHAEICRACAAVCEACADNCESIEGMEHCASLCRRCAESCKQMSASGGAPASGAALSEGGIMA